MKIEEWIKKKSYKPFEIEEQILSEFCKKNSEYWKAHPTNVEQEGYCWIGLFMVEKWMPWLQAKFIFAKGIEAKKGYKTIVLDWEYNEKLEQIYQSYGFDFVCVKERMFHDFKGLLYGFYRAIKSFILYPTGTKFSKQTYKGKQVGHYLYDNIVRLHEDLYTLKRTRNWMCFKKVMGSFWFMHTLERIMDQFPPKEYVFDDLVYDEGLVGQMMQTRKAKLIKCGVDRDFFSIDWSDKPLFWPDYFHNRAVRILDATSEEERNKLIQKATADIEERFKGNNGYVMEAEHIFKNKLSSTVQELSEKMGLDPNKKNVVIFAHCLSENPHKCSTQLYEDHYTWLVETLKLTQKIEKVNWILKGHPIAAIKYGEHGVLEKLYEEYKSPNLHWFPNEYNSALVCQLIDVAVTVYGTVGKEYSCLGVPVIHAGKASYSGFGYTIFPKSVEEYEKALENIDEIQPLTKEQVDKAKLMFEIMEMARKDDFDQFDIDMTAINRRFHQELAENRNFAPLNKETMEAILHFMEKNELTDTCYYTIGRKEG